MSKTRLLVVDDDYEAFLIVRDLLDDVASGRYDLVFSERFEEGMGRILGGEVDAALVDYNMGAKTGLDFMREAVAGGCDRPMILLTAMAGDDMDHEAMAAGATDYLDKDELTPRLLDRTIRYAIERKATEARLIHMARHDILTGLPNRTVFAERLAQAVAQTRRSGHPFGVMFLDLDHFKHVNDSRGHAIGDLFLQVVANRLKSCLRENDVVARLGGDEFGIFLADLSGPGDAANLAHRILRTLEKPIMADSHELRATVSIGITLHPTDGGDVEQLLKNADLAMYRAKHEGRNNYRFFTDSMNAAAIARAAIEAGLHQAIEREEFVLHYQPQLNLKSGRISGAEALIRWQHPSRGLLAPGEFISVAEESGLIKPIGAWVMRQAIRQAKLWQRQGLPPVRMSVNLSFGQFRQADLVAQVEGALRTAELAPGFFELELTETMLAGNVESAVATIDRLHDLGLHLAIDDFGIGYSSLSHLRKFRVGRLKIDRSFVMDMTGPNGTCAIVRAAISLGHSLGMAVVAEGVETEEQLELLRDLNCDEAQGYLISRPLAAPDFERFLRASGEGVLRSIAAA